MTVKQAADRIGISPSLVYLLCQCGELAHSRVGRPGSRGKIIISEADVAAFLQKRRVGLGAEAPEIPARPKQEFRHLRV